MWCIPIRFTLNTTIAFFVMPGCKEQFVCVPVLMYRKVHCAPVLENHSFRHGLTNLQCSVRIKKTRTSWRATVRVQFLI